MIKMKQSIDFANIQQYLHKLNDFKYLILKQLQNVKCKLNQATITSHLVLQWVWHLNGKYDVSANQPIESTAPEFQRKSL